MDSVLGGGYSRTVTKSQPYRGLGLVTWADRAANGGLDIELLRTPVADETGGYDFSSDGESQRSDAQVEWSDCGSCRAWQTATARERERERTLMPTPTTRDYKDSSVTVAKHRPEDKDTLNRALAHLFSPHQLRVKE